ncbi:hypothetical protein GALMADRAFT_160255 [Galerina marginata CBS 339.88]|uniref:Peptidase C14 caspase domain-containing protein n=1 Tax=Galerina marginata (strain CBS 339.88) TaxID=685588 RepID=A0A067SFS0_GALM3|nr:hypothetical protein GALMADRAFT_160255 [Galerina marginata CBS 339.88]
MPSVPLQIDGVQIATSAELLHFLDLVNNEPNEFSPKSPQVQNAIKRGAATKIANPPRMFGLIIGIDVYEDPDIYDLRGAVSDARAIGNYLQDNLNVDQSCIHMLLGRDATRQGIVDALIALKENDNIHRGDAILIYYAGHGQEAGAPVGWAIENNDGKIQCIVPQDFNDDNGIHVLPDRTLGWLIDDIMSKKGDNITVILDCCNSGSGTRNENRDRMARTALLENYSIPPDLDDDIRYMNHVNRSHSPSNGTGLSSHILLAACSAKELAREANGRGQFTQSLENALKSVSPDQITYVQLLDRLQNIAGQNPQLEGNNKHRMVFNARASERVHHSYAISMDASGKYILDAGAADGVCLEAEFSVYADHDSLLKETSLGVMVPDVILPFKSVMHPAHGSGPGPSLDKPALAVQTRAGLQEELQIFIPLEEPLIPVFQAALMQMKTQGFDTHGIKLVDDRSTADLAVERHGGDIIFVILDERVTTHGLTRCAFSVKADAKALRPVLQGAAHYQYHLNRSYLNSEDIENNITVEFFKLELNDDNFGEKFRMVSRRPSGENLYKDGVVSLTLSGSSDEIFGIRITNNWSKDLYPVLFYFDNSELSITPYYASSGPSKFKVDSCLPKEGGTLNLGFGNGGEKPFEYYIPDGQDVDVGFLKCFFSTSPIDLSKVTQVPLDKLSRSAKPSDSKVSDAWGCLLIPVVQRRAK